MTHSPVSVSQAAERSPQTSGNGPGAEVEASEPAVRRAELASFLRSRRERITPEQVGLPPGRRRRTPGLRREEVAQLAVVGVTWYTWLEQARDIQVSGQVADSIARALLLDPAERTHLFALAGVADPHADSQCPALSPAIETMLRQLEPYPAAVINSRLDVLAYNRTYGRLVIDLDQVPVEDRNFLVLSFLYPAWRKGVVDQETVTKVVAKYRAAMVEHMTDPLWKGLVARLQRESPEFCEVWGRHEVLQPDQPTTRFLTTDLGLMTFDYTRLWLGPRSGPQLVTYTPSDEATRERMTTLYERVRGEN
ncbi:helix-turn-helix transcriptional regulator [Streptomyces sp. SP2-10]|uniref:helix-turn-helix transcriptional regulator n=1 Tax=Streptomyces sp. SP2-10 TaxID=2873385 RepID=UPI001CA645F0|nr:helix-turn-helix transcriptional regulator [Streptomyces sp. SP2-10]MBY8842617.1 helix-turn-helix transcriptional regulator [Streptomyces sp. SP2-10]